MVASMPYGQEKIHSDRGTVLLSEGCRPWDRKAVPQYANKWLCSLPGAIMLQEVFALLIREVNESDLDSLQELYLHLHEKEKTPETPELNSLWKEIIADKDYHILVGEVDGRIVSSVTVIVIKNLTRCMRPYALIENVVTHSDYRCRGYAGALMQKAVDIAGSSGCYKVMLLTGAKDENTLRFYEKCGFNSKDKTAFIKWIEA